MCTFTHVCMQANAHTGMHKHASMHACKCMHAFMHAHTHPHKHTQTLISSRKGIKSEVQRVIQCCKYIQGKYYNGTMKAKDDNSVTLMTDIIFA